MDEMKVEDVNEFKYIDVMLSYRFEEQEDIDRIIKAINSFIETNKDGLRSSSINILGYNY